MSRQPEGKLVAKGRKLIADRGGRAFKIQGQEDSFQEVGIPDLLCCYRGRFVGLEWKLPGNKPSAVQLRILNEILDAGGYAAVVETVGEVATLLAKIDAEVEGEVPSSVVRSREYRSGIRSLGKRALR